MIVSDTNLIVYLLRATPETRNAEDVYAIDSDWRAPALWRSEFRNVLWVAMRREGLSLADALELMNEAEATVLDSAAGITSETILAMAAESGCSPYDCEFAALARELHCPLVTSDRALQKAFPGLAIGPSEFVRARSR